MKRPSRGGAPDNPWLSRGIRLLAVSLILVAGPGEGLDQYLVIVNHSPDDVVVTYRPGVFRGPNMEAIAMLQKPMQAPVGSYAKLKKYRPLPDERLVRDAGVVTFTLATDSAAVVGGIWPPTDTPPLDTGTLSLEIERAGEDSSYESTALLSAFSRHSRNLRILELQ